ncbi:hypothetical protein [Streptomyces sp. NPDC007205]|uniref:hypothetical protein n=1 Tax=Streptomyces sp. NPDC007205 TaxID=3154316 RepID=UPI003401C253
MAGPAALATVISQWQPGAPTAVVEVPADGNEMVLRRAAGNDAFDWRVERSPTPPN